MESVPAMETESVPEKEQSKRNIYPVKKVVEDEIHARCLYWI